MTFPKIKWTSGMVVSLDGCITRYTWVPCTECGADFSVENEELETLRADGKPLVCEGCEECAYERRCAEREELEGRHGVNIWGK